MGNLDYEIRLYGYMILEILLENLKGSGELIIELEDLKKRYCKNIVN